ncbi:MAG TPA: amidase [Thermoanaerobaculia bacterium]|nr:amidase [Thermoanaerobaculia bacterium]
MTKTSPVEHGSRDLHTWSATRVAAAIRDRLLRSRDHLEALLGRVAERNGPLNLVVTLDEERARREADTADVAVRRGDPLGPLHGVCMTVKDSFQTRGMRTTCGAPAYAELVPDVDAVPVARLRAAGAVIFGKTNVPMWANDVQSYNEVFGVSNNPWDTSRTVGGSSGGAAGALAAGFTPIELGSDIGGSIRGPASTCGVTGHKPSWGIVPALGQIPGPPGTLTQADIAVAGPLARDVEDLELLLGVLAGPDDWQATAWQLELPPPRRSRLRDYRVAVWLDEPFAPIAGDVRALLVEAAESLRSAGAAVDFEARPDFGFDYAVAVFRQLLAAAECGGYSRDEIEHMAATGEGDDGFGASLYAQRHRAWLSANERRLQMRRKWRSFFERFDAVLLPVLPTTAIPHDHSEPKGARQFLVNGERRSYFEQLWWVGLTGVAWLPATVVPVGMTPSGLPVGVQIAGPYLEDRTCLDLARHVLELRGGFRPPPGYE